MNGSVGSFGHGLRRTAFVLLSAALVACTTTSPESTPSSAVSRAPAAASSAESNEIPFVPTSDDPKCANAEPQERVVVRAGTTVVTSTGLAIRFGGVQIDHFDDGRHDTLVDLSIVHDDGTEADWLPSLYVERVRAFGGFCLTIVSATFEEAILDLAPVEHALPPCHPSCCSTAERGPVPGGAVECCFCTEQDAL